MRLKNPPQGVDAWHTLTPTTWSYQYMVADMEMGVEGWTGFPGGESFLFKFHSTLKGGEGVNPMKGLTLPLQHKDSCQCCGAVSF
jgi:hypothetical protein